MKDVDPVDDVGGRLYGQSRPARPDQPVAAPLPAATAPRYRLYTPEQITLACFIGTPVASAWLMAHNWARLGRRQWAVLGVVVSVLATAAALVAASFMRGALAEVVSLLMLTVMVHFLSRGLHGEAVRQHRQAGGATASTYAAAARGAVALVLVVAAGLAYRWVWRSEVERFAPIDRSARIANGTVYLKGQAGLPEAVRLVELFRQYGFAPKNKPFTLGLKIDETTTVYVVTPPGAGREPGVMEALDDFGRVLQREGFGPPLEMAICEGRLTVKRRWVVAPAAGRGE